MPSPRLTEPEFRKRFLSGFKGAAFERLGGELDKLVSAAWEAYETGDKSPLTRKAGPGFADPDYDLSLDWIAAHDAITAAQLKHDDPAAPARFLLINASPRSEHTCPGEMSKTFRLVEAA